ncbi:MAG: amidohydrolase family protein [Lentisphaerae bacterium]|nr:amidohydrolase family protein [Lentisphaerota bacterium]MBT4815666.1 amidohydrolase family protein [Lentisphaerota bacterium]MBT5609241.1 amidohydrolase family protein [Lentisphaerota bacterium]MBT7059880.1 amidohydrolase family protein [Lentisphaerota bacterium]MBT7847113.1 amidohydrolase family protein [Lentisphaerota bacterium]
MFIDIHVHTSSMSDLPWGPGREAPCTPEQLIEMYDDVGISSAVLLPFVTPECNILTQSNEEILAIADRFPGRFIPFCNIDPRLSVNSADLDLSFVINHYKEKGCKGIGEITANLSFDDPRVTNLFDHAEACGMPVTFHVAIRDRNIYGLIDDLGLPRLEKQLAAHPGLVFFGHSQSFWANMSADITEEEWGGYPKGPVVAGGRIPELMRRYPNLYGDLSAGSGFNAVSRDPEFGYAFLNEFQDQLCFATDVCAPSGRQSVLIYLKQFLEDGLGTGKLPQEAFDKITHRNAQRVLKLAN